VPILPKEAIPIETLDLIDQLEDLGDRSRQILNLTFINTEEFYELIKRIRTSLPADVKEAARITREADHIINDAREQAAQIIDQAKAEAANIVEEARAEATRLVDNSEIKRLAAAQAKEIVAAAEEEAKATKIGADQYAQEVLEDLESFVDKVLGTIQRGREKLERKSEMQSGDE